MTIIENPIESIRTESGIYDRMPVGQGWCPWPAGCTYFGQRGPQRDALKPWCRFHMADLAFLWNYFAAISTFGNSENVIFLDKADAFFMELAQKRLEPAQSVSRSSVSTPPSAIGMQSQTPIFMETELILCSKWARNAKIQPKFQKFYQKSCHLQSVCNR